MIRKPMTVQLASGLEARPVAVLVQVASQYESKIYVEIDNKKVNAKTKLSDFAFIYEMYI